MTIPTFRKGQKLKAADMQALADVIRANRILPGVGIRVTGTPNGTMVALSKGRGGGEGGSSNHPFQCLPGTNGKFKVRPGLVIFNGGKGILPSNLNEEFTAPPNNTSGYFCWIRANLVSVEAGSLIQTSLASVVLEAGNSLPDHPQPSANGAPPNFSTMPLFYVTTTAPQEDKYGIDTVNQVINQSLSLNLTVTDVSCSQKFRGIYWSGL